MTFKSLLFCLFLYVCLVWVGAAYLHSGPGVQEFGLRWTAAGLITILAVIVLSRLWGWVRVLRAKALMKPKAAPRPAQPVNEDDAAMTALIAEANATLTRAGNFAGKHNKAPLNSLPLYLLIGPEGVGKTTTLLNSGLEPKLLAGDAGVSRPSSSTRLCNLWLAEEALFIELGGRAFSGDPARWRRLLRSLQARPSVPMWRRLWSAPEETLRLNGVLAFCDMKEFTGAATPQGRERLDRQCRDWQERLGVVGEVFGPELPVYVVVTKSDSIPYFADYFRRISESEAREVLGCTLPVSHTTGVNSKEKPREGEVKRLTRSFSTIYHALAERRIEKLAQEPDPSRRPGIYEFPRELKRVRSALVQFLTSTFRQHALGPSPELRGYYLSAIGEQASLPPQAESGTRWADQSLALEATGLFRAEATHIFRPSEPSAGSKPASGGTIRRWLFVSELFKSVIRTGQARTLTVRVDPRIERYRQISCAAVCGICALLCFAFLNSWTGNARLLDAVRYSAETQKHGTTPTLSELELLDSLRAQVSQLVHYDHKGPPISLRWGLYSGNSIAQNAKDLYFRRFRNLLLIRLNDAIVAHLYAVPATPGLNDPYSPVFRLLKAHLMLSSGSCAPDPHFVSGVLKDTLNDVQIPTGNESQWNSLARRQIDFYAGELRYGNPCKLAENAAARDRARQYLSKIQGVDRIYASILAAGEKTLVKPQRLVDLAPAYSKVLNGPGEVSGIFSQNGWAYVEQASKKGNVGSQSDPCVLGENSQSGERRQTAETERAIQRMFIKDYVNNWRNFVAGFSVRAYGSAADAAKKLDLLSDHKSPLLAVFALTSNQTNFTSAVHDPGGLEQGTKILKKILPALGGAAKSVEKAANANNSSVDPMSSPVDITGAFQPVQWVVPPGSETWVTEKNNAYIDALAELGRAMQQIAQMGPTPDAAVYSAAGQNYDKALDAARQVAKGFKLVGVDGLDGTVQALLEAPITQSKRFIISDLGVAAAGKVNGELKSFCAGAGNALHKYPFRVSANDLTLEELTNLFAPGTGVIWKFQAKTLADLVMKDGGHWKPKDPEKKPQVTPEMLMFLNRAQAVSDAFYPAGANQPRLTYTLRPKLDPSYKDSVVELDVDGQVHAWTSSLQKQFSWPPPEGTKSSEVIGRIRTGSVSFSFASRRGLWSVFRVMADAEPRPVGSRIVEWKYVGGRDGHLEAIVPVQLEIVEFPGGGDLFNPKFFEGLQCPLKAVQ